MSRDGAPSALSGTKRPADDNSDLLTMKIDLKSTPPYELSQEQNLPSITQSKDWATYKACENEVEQLFTGPPAKFGYKDKFIQGLLDKVHACISGRKTEDVLLCVQGPMGMGKSATLNSLFGVGPIAREGDLGGSCTLCSCVYRAPKKGQEAPFMAEVTFFSHWERQKILNDYVASYWNVRHGNNDDDDADPSDRPSGEDGEDSVDIQNEVVDALISLFGNQPECRTKQNAKRFLNSATSPDDPAILTKLHAWSDSLVSKATNDKSVITIEASTAGQLAKLLAEYTSYAENDYGDLTVSLTPMVCLITFYFDCPLTRLGMAFQDMPGSTDCNRVRKLSAMKYRENRTHCAILSDESRAKDDSEISKELKIMSRRGTGRLVVIITRSDLIKADTMPNGSKNDRERASQLKKTLEKCEGALNALEIKETAAINESNDELLLKLVRDRQELEIRQHLIENAETAHRIRMRSVHNKKVLEDKLRYISPNPPPILSISNKEYARHLDGYKAKNTPVLDVEQTNIPELRRIISTFPNEARVNEIKQQQEGVLPALLRQVALYTEHSPSERKESIEEHIVNRMSQCSWRLTKVLTPVEEALARALDVIKHFNANGMGWRAKASELCDIWDAFENGAFLTILKRDGHRKGSRKKAEVHLSADLINISSKVVAQEMEALISSVMDLQRTVEDEMEELVDRMIQDLREDENSPCMALNPFYDYVYAEKASIRVHVRTYFQNLLHRMDEIRRKMATEDEDAYMIEAMLPIYAQVRELRGHKNQKLPRPKIKGGWPAERRRVIREEVTKFNGVWASVFAVFEDALRTTIKEETARLIQGVNDVFKNFHDGFNTLCEEKDTSNPNGKLVREELKRNVEEAKRILEGPMQQAYEAMNRDFRRTGVNDD